MSQPLVEGSALRRAGVSWYRHWSSPPNAVLSRDAVRSYTLCLTIGRNGFVPLAAYPAYYFCEVLIRNYDAERVYRDGDGLKIEFPFEEVDVRVDPMVTATVAIKDVDSFAESYDELLATIEAELDHA